MASSAALSYHEPSIVTVLVISSFLILVNVVNYIFDQILFCGLIGQIAVGMAWGTPGGKWLPEDTENAIMQLGYLGLIMVVFEGGLSTDLKTLRSNLLLSSVVALIGISAPIGLSFSLQGLMNITQVQAFAAGAALCSTSLGTTFTILSTSGLSQSRLGVVLSSAAMMDDIVGLVMSSIISSLGRSSDFSAITVVRPVLVSIAFAVLLPLICSFIVGPLTAYGCRLITYRKATKLSQLLRTEGAALVFHTLILTALVTSASYAGTSVLFAAYLAGAFSTWWDGAVRDISQRDRRTPSQDATPRKPHMCKDKEDLSLEMKIPQPVNPDDNGLQETNNVETSKADQPNHARSSRTHKPSSQSSAFPTAVHIFEKHYRRALKYILKPFFFASIGFSIPISKMFDGTVVWKGIVYSILMMFGKLLCGVCLLPFQGPSKSFRILRSYWPSIVSDCWPLSKRLTSSKTMQAKQTSQGKAGGSLSHSSRTDTQEPSPLQTKKPMSLYPAALLGSAMVARGEIGFLISSIAESDGVFGRSDDGGSSELFLVVTWAILLCTLLGPITVGLMVKRVKRLQATERSQRTGRENPLGSWGIVPSG